MSIYIDRCDSICVSIYLKHVLSLDLLPKYKNACMKSMRQIHNDDIFNDFFFFFL